jgi:hypothetical protein
MVVRRRVWDPCFDEQVAVVGATVFLLDHSGNVIAETTTDEEGYYEFFSLPISRYSVQVIYPECASEEPSLAPTKVHSIFPSKFPTRLPSSHPSQLPSFKPSFLPSASPSVSPTEGMVVRRRVLDPCYDEEVALVGATVYLYDFAGNIIAETTTGNDGYYEFLSLPLSRYSVEVIYPECASEKPSSVPSKLQSNNPSNIPSMVLSSIPSVRIICQIASFVQFHLIFTYIYLPPLLFNFSEIKQTIFESLSVQHSYWILGSSSLTS